MSAPTLTPAQQRALDWLPRNDVPKKWERGISPLSLRWLERRGFSINCHYKGATGWRLTPLGIATFYPERVT